MTAMATDPSGGGVILLAWLLLWPAAAAALVALPLAAAGTGHTASTTWAVIELLAAAGFHRIEELQPSRHRLAVELTGVAGPVDLLAGFSATTRNMVRAAERSDLRIVRHGPLVLGDYNYLTGSKSADQFS